MLKKNDRLVPSAFEVWCVVLASAAMLVVGCAKTFLQRYDLIGSSNLLHAQFSNALGTGLGRLDAFGFTADAVTFLVWGGAGLLLFSIAQVLLRSVSALSFQRQLSSNEYIHPAGFDRSKYWRNIVRSIILSWIFLLLFVVASFFYIAFVIPVSFYYTQNFFIHSTLLNTALLVYGIFTMVFGTFVLYLCFRLMAWQHQRNIH